MKERRHVRPSELKIYFAYKTKTTKSLNRKTLASFISTKYIDLDLAFASRLVNHAK